MKDLLTPPVIWFLVGVVLLLLELALPGLVIFFFGLGAWIVALCLVLFPVNITWQLLIFVISSLAGLFLLRRFLKEKFFREDESNKSSLEEEFIGKTAVADTDINPGISGKVNFKGTQWTAISDEAIKKGEKVRIKERESITLIVEKFITKK
jgi:membrane protein implicated in regulation of membrane protease activity